jgi:predicted nucleic acid-binding protein
MASTYVDSSAIVKLVIDEPRSAELRRALETRQLLVTSSLARVEVLRALLPQGDDARQRGVDALGRLALVRMNDRILDRAASLRPPEVRSLDAIHLATALELGGDLAAVVTYDRRMAATGRALGIRVESP